MGKAQSQMQERIFLTREYKECPSGLEKRAATIKTSSFVNRSDAIAEVVILYGEGKEEKLPSTSIMMLTTFKN